MKVRAKTLQCGPQGTVHAGDVIDVSDAEAEELVNGDFAVYYERPTPKAEARVTAVVPAPEIAVPLAAARETASAAPTDTGKPRAPSSRKKRQPPTWA